MAARKSVLLILALCSPGISRSLSCCRCCWCCRCRSGYSYSNCDCLGSCLTLLVSFGFETYLDLVSSWLETVLDSELAVLLVDREFLLVLVYLDDLECLLAAGILDAQVFILGQNCLLPGVNSHRNRFDLKFCFLDLFL